MRCFFECYKWLAQTVQHIKNRQCSAMYGKPNATATEEIHTNPLASSVDSTRSRTKWTKFFNRNLQINRNHRFINVHFKVHKYCTNEMIIQMFYEEIIVMFVQI